MKKWHISLGVKYNSIGSLYSKGLLCFQNLYKGHQLLPDRAGLSFSESIVEVFHQGLDDVGIEYKFIYAGTGFGVKLISVL